MKKIIFLLLFSTGVMAVNAQTKTDPSPLKKSTGTPAIPNATGVSKAAIGRLPKERDLALSDLKIEKDNTGKFYTISCKLSNIGTSDINLRDGIAYLNCNGYTAMYTKVIHCYITVGSCNDSCRLAPNFMLWVYKPDGTVWDNSGGNNAAHMIKPGETFSAKAGPGGQITSNYLSSRCGNTMTVTLVVDPLNKVGDQNLENNRISATIPYNN